ncbi:hypothetical protein GCM10009789_22110 [Kribbella sancticallisti]|uniref:Uncharacterized protein n=1 Tax=Kribbella sancticallisti TaxID=460087 RepID=A0ABP4NUT9_9ACTN
MTRQIVGRGFVSGGAVSQRGDAYEGAFVVVSHDERFLTALKVSRRLRLAGRLLEMGAPDRG